MWLWMMHMYSEAHLRIEVNAEYIYHTQFDLMIIIFECIII